MGFASAYLEKRALFHQKIVEAPDYNTGLIVVVPCFNEPGIGKMLDSLAQCKEPICKTEVIIVINAPDDASAESIENNRRTLISIEEWKRQNSDRFFRLFAFNVEEHSMRGWGVGMARKTGMDEAVRRFDNINRPNGVIVNLDADCAVEKNYFVSLYSELFERNDRSACSIYFEHPLSGIDWPDSIYRYISLYELHLRYYKQGLDFSGFPYCFHTVGSSLAVKALTYIRTGGMNRRQAGEDFYFIQKLVPQGGYFDLTSTTVFPSPRPSSRVPFGTGASVGKLEKGNGITLLTYNVSAFSELRLLFEMTEILFKCSSDELMRYYLLLPPGLKSFLDESIWIHKLIEIKKNTSGLKSFEKRFFEWFNMFKIVKYLNYSHPRFFEKKPVDVSATELLKMKGCMVDSEDSINLLLFYRQMEKAG